MAPRKSNQSSKKTTKNTSSKKASKAVAPRGGATSLKNAILAGDTSKTPAVKPVTHVALLVDKSGSMDGHQANTLKAFKRIAEPIRAKATEQDIRVSLYQFGSDCYTSFTEKSVDSLENLTKNDYDPNDGTTKLRDSLLSVMEDLKKLPDVDDPNSSFLVAVITDGQDNASRRSNWEASNFVKEAQATDRWTFVVSCPSRDVDRVNQELGIPKGNIQGWNERDDKGMEDVAQAQSVGLTNYFVARSQKKGSVNDFFAQVNIGRQGIRQVTKDLEAEDAGRFKRLTVAKATNVKEFVESKKLKFELGRLFYSLSKPETVQHHKEIILQRRDNPDKMYGGDQVREKLGIPRGQDGKVEPGNLGEWVVWIQSTSPNRKLLAGMEVLYDTNPVVSNTGRGTTVSR